MRRLWKLLVMVTLAASVPGIAVAQNDGAAMTAYRSLSIQRQLRAIEADRTAFASRLLSEWSVYLDNSKYDLQEELREIIMRAPVWQLYGASLAGDFKTMVQVLRGVRPAGPYINNLTAPERKSSLGTAGFQAATLALAESDAPLAFGGTTDQLVFTPIAPCRIVDTRGTGARTGILSAGSTRNFDLTTSAFIKGQGGATSGCPGLPSFSYLGWSVNVTVTGYSGFGWLTAWGAGGVEPTASIINYSATIAPAVANGVTLIGCYGCGDDISIKAAAADTHVIIDVVGYYSEPSGGTASTVTRVAGTAFNTAGTAFFSIGGACPAGTLLVGGEMDHDDTDLAIGETRSSGTSWVFWMINNTGGTVTGTPYSRCLDAPLRVP